ncbi:hypothetical conserved protein [Dictyoglomus thermophilum H-6-12]|uniref:Hypothetical conserved protein n=1 Tax=Dictyoglomus thermophilum (strain ATCC 35947 / DSM 3960 / H-6-12) TaxID=309799 RepID=B5YAY7_DICT6|nr:hypothetical conserved protein [Dictyoglomus thermophilum H-6-12]
MRIILFLFSWLIGWIYYRNLRFLKREGEISGDYKTSVIIPARNEEENLGKLLSLLKKQTYKPYEVIVVNDNSEDDTEGVGERNGARVISLYEEPPEGWVGKNWAIWNGYLESRGDILLFLDADVEPSSEFIEVMLSSYERYGGLISCWPYQRFEKFYEHLNFAFNLVSVFSMAFLGKKEGAFGPAMMISRKDYERIGGHKEVRNKIVEDMEFAKKCLEEGISVNNFLGGEYIKFRMYPHGIKDLFQGFSKNMAKGAFSINIVNFLLIFLYMTGVYGSIFYFRNTIFNFLYILYAIQFSVIQRRLGDYKWYDFLFYPLHFLFFLLVFTYSILRVFFVKTVVWKGRKIRVG